MALYDWKKLNSNIFLKNIKKKLFDQYYFSVKYYCPGARIILTPGNDNYENISDAIARRKLYYSPYHISAFTQPPINPLQLLDWVAVKNNHGSNVKIRIVEPHVTMYASNEETLLKIASYDLGHWVDDLVEIRRPESNEIKTILDNNAILVKTDNGFRYKIICKEGIYQHKNAIYSLLDRLEDQVKVSKTVWTYLESSSAYLRNIWFYTNDSNIAQLLNIIEPNCVTNIHELVVSPNK